MVKRREEVQADTGKNGKNGSQSRRLEMAEELSQESDWEVLEECGDLDDVDAIRVRKTAHQKNAMEEGWDDCTG